MKSLKEAVIRDFSDAVRLDNFRLDSNGSLVKREGYEFAAYLDGKVRGAQNDYETSYIVAGYSFYKYADSTLSYIGYLSSAYFDDADEPVFMFIYARTVYIMGGGTLYSYDPDSGRFGEVDGYAPLIFKNSNPTCNSFEEYEAPNVAGYSVRTHYNFTKGTSRYYLWGNATSVKAVYMDGVLLTSSYYTTTISGQYSYITIKTAYFDSNTDLVIEYTLDPTTHPGLRYQLFKRTKAALYERDGIIRMLIYGGELGDKVYISDFSHFDPVECATDRYTAVKENGEEYNTVYEMLPIHKKERFDYFTETSFATAGFDGDTVRAIERLTDHYMVFTRSSVYRIEHVEGLVTGNELETTGIKTCLVTDEYGIGESSGTIVYEDSLYFYNENGLYRYRYNSLNYDFISANIPIADYAAPDRKISDRVRLFLYRRYGELWCCYDGYVSVYSLKHKLWYRFTGISADLLFCHDSHAALASGSIFYVFDEYSYTDSGTGFEAVFESKNYDLGNKFTKKTLFGFGVCIDRVSGASLIATLTSDKGISLSLSYSPDAASDVSPAVMRSHARLSAVSYVKCVLVSPAGQAPANIRELMFRYREIGGEQ